MKTKTNAEKLLRWLEDFELDRVLTEETGAGSAWRPRVETGAQIPLAAGQIRLWPASSAGDVPLYGLLLAGGYGLWRMIPFSPLALAATPEEWACRESGPARVLQGWNRRELPSAVAANSWCAEDASAELLFTCERWWASLEAGLPAPASMAEEAGPPLRHPLDPRHDYLLREWGRVSRHVGEPDALRTEMPAAWAAEGGAVYGRCVWRIGDSGDRWVADADGAWIESSAGAEAWVGAVVCGDAGEWVWEGTKLRVAQAHRVAWTALRWREEIFPLVSGGAKSQEST